MNIGEAAGRSGLPEKTIRYYETVGLIKPKRQPNGFRNYGEREVQLLSLIGRARGTGFTVDECRSLIGLFTRRRSSPLDVDVARHLDAIEQKQEELRSIELALKRLRDGHGSEIGSQWSAMGSDGDLS